MTGVQHHSAGLYEALRRHEMTSYVVTIFVAVLVLANAAIAWQFHDKLSDDDKKKKLDKDDIGFVQVSAVVSTVVVLGSGYAMYRVHSSKAGLADGGNAEIEMR